jgi:hypothetical protein
VLYRLIVHAPAPDDAEAGLERLRAVLAAGGVEVDDLRLEEGSDGAPVFHVESKLDAPSAYHAARVSGTELYARLLAEGAGVDPRRIHVTAERIHDDGSPQPAA